MTASIWRKGTVVSDTDRETITLQEYQIGTVGQTVFNLSSLIYGIGSGLLRVYKDGDLLAVATHYTETSSSSITLTTPLVESYRLAFVLTVNSETMAQQLADAQAAADAAQYYASLSTQVATKESLARQLYTKFTRTSGTANAYVGTVDPDSSFTFSTGYRVAFTASFATNTGPVTININNRGAKAIKKRIPGGAVSELSAGDLIYEQVYDIVYSASANCFVLVGTISTQQPFAELDILRQQVIGVI